MSTTKGDQPSPQPPVTMTSEGIKAASGHPIDYDVINPSEVPLQQQQQPSTESQRQQTSTIYGQPKPGHTLVGEVQSRLMQQHQVPHTGTLPKGLSPTEQQEILSVSSGSEQSQPPQIEKISAEDLANRQQQEEQESINSQQQSQSSNPQHNPVSGVRFTPIIAKQNPVPGGVRQEVVGQIEQKPNKIYWIEQRPGESIMIKPQPNYFYQSQFYPGMSQQTAEPIQDATIDYLNSLVAKNTHCLLGRTGVKVSRITLGTMNFGQVDPAFGDRPGQLDESAAHAILDRFVELGGNCIDTASFFPWFGTCGESERIIGSWLEKQDRSKLFLVTKVRMPLDVNNINSGGLSRAHILNAIDLSLSNLKTDYVDMLMLNGFDPTVSISETARHLNDLVEAQKVRYLGVCDFKGWQLQKFIDALKFQNMHKCVCYEGEYNLLTRGCELEVADVCKNERIGFFAYAPFKSGFLTEAYTPETSAPVEGSRIEAVSKKPTLVSMAEPFEEMRSNPIYEHLLVSLDRIGKARNLTSSQIAILWALQRGFVSSCVVGVSNVQELEEAMSCISGDTLLTREELCELDFVSAYRLQYPYTLHLAPTIGYREIEQPTNINFGRFSFYNEFVPLHQMESMRLGAHETYHEAPSLNYAERQKFGEQSPLSPQQQQQQTPMSYAQKQQLLGLHQSQQEQTLQSGKYVPPLESQVTAQQQQHFQQPEYQTRT